jgi:hypothetical protein
MIRSTERKMKSWPLLARRHVARQPRTGSLQQSLRLRLFGRAAADEARNGGTSFEAAGAELVLCQIDQGGDDGITWSYPGRQ